LAPKQSIHEGFAGGNFSAHCEAVSFGFHSERVGKLALCPPT